MIILNNNELEIGIYPGRCIQAKNLKKHTERTIKWSEVRKSGILRLLTENLMNRLTYELNGITGVIFDYEPIEEATEQPMKAQSLQPQPDPPVWKPSSQKMFLKSKEVEELYGLKAQTLANWRYQGVDPKYHKIGGAVRYKVEDLNDFMEKGRIKTDSI
jgi:hypothetical protein